MIIDKIRFWTSQMWKTFLLKIGTRALPCTFISGLSGVSFQARILVLDGYCFALH